MAVTTWRYPGTTASVSPGDEVWSSPGNIVSDNASYASSTAVGGGGTTETLKATNFGFVSGDFPAGWTITGVSAFPSSPSEGDYALRVDFVPNRLFRYVSGKWLLREVDRKREWNNYNWTDALAGFMTDRTEEQDMRPWEYRSIHDVATERQERFSPSPKSEDGAYPPLPELGSWTPMVQFVQAPSFCQADDSVRYTITLPGGTTAAFLHPALEAPSGVYDDFYVQYTATRSTGQEVGELVINDDGSVASIRQEADTIGTVGISFSAGHSGGTRIFRYTTTPGPSVTFKFKVARRPNMSYATNAINDIFELCVPVIGFPDPNETLIIYTAAHGIRIEETRCFGRAIVPATTSSTFGVFKNSIQVGSVTFGAGETEALVWFTDVNVAIGDTLTVVAPIVQDATLSNVSMTIGGFRSKLVPVDPGSAFTDMFEISVPVVGMPEPGELLVIYTASHEIVLDESRSFAHALVAATAPKTFIVNKNGVQVGTLVFGAGASDAVVDFTDATVSIGDTVTVVAPVAQDATLADIGLTLGGFR